MAITLVDFRAQFPEFDAISDARVQLYIDEATVCFDDAEWGIFLNYGLLYYVAFNVQLFAEQQSNPSSSSPVSSVTDAALSLSFAITASDNSLDNFYLSNKYGQKYLEYRTKAIGVVLTAVLPAGAIASL